MLRPNSAWEERVAQELATGIEDEPVALRSGDRGAAVAARRGGHWSPVQIYVVFAVLTVTVLNYLDRGVLGVIQEPLKHELRLSDSQLGMLAGPAFAIFYSLAGLPTARLAERFNRARLLAATVWLWSAMTAICGSATSFSQLALFRGGVGMGEGGCIPVSQSLLSDYFGARQGGLAMSVVAAAASIAAVFTPLVGAFVAHTYGWRATFWAMGLPGLGIGLIVLLTLKDPRRHREAGAVPQTESFLTDAKWLLSNAAFRFQFLAAVFTGISVSGLGSFRISFLIRDVGMSLTGAGVVAGIAGIFGVAGAFVGGFLADRLADSRGRSYVLVPALAALLTFICNWVTFSTASTVAIGALLIGSFTYNLKDGPAYAATQNMIPSRMRATGAAFHMLAATAIGGAIGPLVTGALSDFGAARRYGSSLAAFQSACPGGQAPAHAAALLHHACTVATAEGLRFSLLVVSLSILVAMVSLLLCSRTIRYAEPEAA
jgi:MFS family permease